MASRQRAGVEELNTLVEEGTADTILVDHEISPSQARNLEKATRAVVMDRTAVIPEIFHRHARSRAAKAQVEIVRLQYMAPRLREQATGRDRQRGGIGGRGAGESNLEVDRRKIRDRVAELTAVLSSLEQERRTQRARRRDLARVALVGYTNAGKSTLMRALTGSEVYVARSCIRTPASSVSDGSSIPPASTLPSRRSGAWIGWRGLVVLRTARSLRRPGKRACEAERKHDDSTVPQLREARGLGDIEAVAVSDGLRQSSDPGSPGLFDGIRR